MTFFYPSPSRRPLLVFADISSQMSGRTDADLPCVLKKPIILYIKLPVATLPGHRGRCPIKRPPAQALPSVRVSYFPRSRIQPRAHNPTLAEDGNIETQLSNLNWHENQEDVNGEELTVKKMVDFWCRFFTVYAEFFTAYEGHKR